MLVWLLFTIAIVLPFRWIPPPTTAFIVWNALDPDVPPVTYRWTPLERISPELPLCVVAAEDQKFPVHRGFDLESIRDALGDSGRRRGASTITQQVAKNLYLWSGRSYVRKGLEAYLTVWIELLWSKRRILEVYVNVAEFGPGVFGARAASERYFGREPAAITRAQAALLAAVLPNPKQLSVVRPSPYVLQRQRQIMAQARALGGSQYLPLLD